MRPSQLLDVGFAAHRRITRTIRCLADDEFEQPSLLPGWTRAHVIAWLALKSQSHVLLFAAQTAGVGDSRGQFPDGYDQSEAIRAELARGPAGLRDGLDVALAELENAWDQLPGHLWTAKSVTSAGRRSMIEIVGRHLRDVEVHHVDLDAGYSPAEWPAEFVDLELGKRLRDLPGRTDSPVLLAWLLGRSPAPDLRPW